MVFFLFRISKEEVAQTSSTMIENLFGVLTMQGSEENEYVMKG